MSINISPELEALVQQKAAERRISPEQLIHDAVLADVHRNGTPPPTAEPDPHDPEVYFATELATYERHREELEREHMGKFALFREDALIGVYPTSDAAELDGIRRFGPLRFMVMEVGDPVIEMLWGLY